MFKKSREKLWITLAMGFCGLSFCLLLSVLYDGLQTRLQNNPQPTPSYSVMRAKPVAKSPTSSTKPTVTIMDFSNAPLLSLGRFRYQILGLGQNPETGRQIVWVRSLTSNRVGDFAVGEPLFGGPVTITRITAQRVDVSYRSQTHQVPLVL